MPSRIIELALKKPERMLIFLALIIVISSFGFINAGLFSDYTKNLRNSHPMATALKEQENTFGTNDTIIITIAPKNGKLFTPETLSVINEITTESERAPYSQRVDSITNYSRATGNNGELVTQEILNDPLNLSTEEISNAREIIMASPELVGRLVSRDSETTLIIVSFSLSQNQLKEVPLINEFIHSMLADKINSHPELNFYVSGSVEYSKAWSETLAQDIKQIFPLSLLVMIVLMLLITRSISATIVVLAVSAITTLIAMGLACWVEKRIDGVILFSQVIILFIAATGSAHMMISYLRYLRQGYPKERSIELAISNSYNAGFITTFFMIAFFLCLNFHNSPIFNEIGNIVAFGIGLAFFLYVTLLPALMKVIPFKVGTEETGDNKAIKKWANFIIKHNKLIFVISVVTVVGIIGYGLPKNVLNENFSSELSDSSAYKNANDFVNKKVSGVQRLFYTFDSGNKNGIHDPQYQQQIEDFSNWLRSQPEVTHVLSYTDTVKRLNKVMNGNEDAAYRLPNNSKLSNQYTSRYETSLPINQGLDNIVSGEQQKTLIEASVLNSSSSELLTLHNRAEEWLNKNTSKNIRVNGASIDLLYSKLATVGFPPAVYDTYIALIIVSALLVLVFRSLPLAILAVVSNIIPVTLAYGVWGIIKGNIGIGVAATSLLVVSIAVDNTVHFIYRYRSARMEDKSITDAINETLQTTGMAMLMINIVFAAGFIVLVFCQYQQIVNMGLLAALTIFLILAIDLLMLPAWLIFSAKGNAHKSLVPDGYTNFESPPTPREGVMGHLTYLADGDNGCLYDSTKKMQQRYGGIFKVFVLGSPWVVISDLDAIHKVLITERENYTKDGDALDEIKSLLGDQGILVTEGEQWARQRKLSMPAFRQEKLKLMMNNMNAIALSSVEQLKKDNNFEAHQFVNRIGLAIICKTGFDYDISSFEGSGDTDPILHAEEEGCKELMKRIQRTKYWKKLPIPSNFRIKKIIDESTDILMTISRQREDAHESSAVLLDMLKAAKDENGEKLEEGELLQLVHHFVAAGHETTGALLQWLLYYLCTHPDIQENVRKEVNQVMGDSKEVAFEHYKQMEYLNKVIKETLRLRPPIPIMLRSTKVDTELNGYYIKKGSSLSLVIGAVQNNPEIWGNNYNSFDPSHFDDDKMKLRPKHCFIPFGLGPRICVGHQFSMVEATVVIAQLVRHYHFELLPGQKIRPFLQLVWTMKDNLNVKATPLKVN